MVKPLRHVYYNHQTLFSIEDHVMYLQSNRYQDDDENTQTSPIKNKSIFKSNTIKKNQAMVKKNII